MRLFLQKIDKSNGLLASITRVPRYRRDREQEREWEWERKHKDYINYLKGKIKK